jgi:predicted RNA-binding Zn-ribbon protein involved in translation (DUF1610 family)
MARREESRFMGEVLVLLSVDSEVLTSKQTDQVPGCPRCGGLMGLARVVPSIFDQASGPTTRTFACRGCGTTITRQTRPKR